MTSAQPDAAATSTLLLEAAELGDLAAVQRALADGASASVSTNFGTGALALAASEHRKKYEEPCELGLDALPLRLALGLDVARRHLDLVELAQPFAQRRRRRVGVGVGRLLLRRLAPGGAERRCER